MSLVYALHNSISATIAFLLRNLLPTEDETWGSLVPHDIEHADDTAREGKEWNEEQWLRTMKSRERIMVFCFGKRHRVLDVLMADGGMRFANLPAHYTQMNRFQQAHFLTGAWTEIVAKTHRAKPGQGFKVTSQFKVEPL